jgi:hypothetical protein
MIVAKLYYDMECPELYAAEVFLRNRGYSISKVVSPPVRESQQILNESYGGGRRASLKIIVNDKCYNSIQELYKADSNGELPKLLRG